MSDGLIARALAVGYGTRPVALVQGFEVSPDRVTLVLGPNGSGKTTLLKTLAGLLPPVSGTFDPRPAPGPGGAVYVHSTPFLFSGTVGSNLLATGRGREAEARQALGAFEAEDLWKDDVRTLSRGQRQRVAMARALAIDPILLLADEPEGGMDGQAIECWRTVMRRALAARRPLIVVAAHRPVAFSGIPVDTVELG